MKKLLRALALTLTLALCLALPVTAQAHEHLHLGDPMGGFTVTTPEGETITYDGLMEQYNGVLINFWYDGCGWCDYEFPFLQTAYETYGDEIAVLALSPYDDDAAIAAYKAARGLTFPMATDTASLAESFGVTGYPTTVMIDRFGVICFVESGAQQSADAFMGLMEGFIGDDYTESKVGYTIPGPKPDIDNPASEAVAAAANAEGGNLVWTASEASRAWPWIPAEADGRTVLSTSNAGKHSTAAETCVNLTADAGDALAFDLKVSTESGYDFFSLKVNGETVKSFSGVMDWISYAHAFDAAGEYEIAFAFEKDYIGESGEDAVMLDNVRLLSGEAAAEAIAANPYRPAPIEGESFTLSIADASAQPVSVLGADGMPLTEFVGAPVEGFFLVEEEAAAVRIQLGDAIDHDTVMLSTTNTSGVVTMCGKAEDGYYYTVALDEASTGGAPFVPFYLYIDVRESTQIDDSVVIFASAEGADMFCQSYGAYLGQSLTWEPAGDAPAAAAALPAEVEYALTFVDESGAPLTGVLANICDESTCTVAVSDAAGRAVFTAAPYAYDVHIIKAPDGYAVDSDAAWKLDPAGGELVITLAKAE